MAQEINGQQVEIEIIQNIAAGAAVDGWDLTQGSKVDATVTAAAISATPTTSASVVALLKGILTGQSSGTGGGASTVASGADVTEGATTDAPLTAAASAAASTLNAATKGLFNLFFNGTAKVGLSAGTNVIGGVTIAAGSDASTGNLTDAPAAAVQTTSTSTTVIGLLKGLYNLLYATGARVAQSVYWQEFNGTSIAANATSTGAARTFGGAQGTSIGMGYFQYVVFCSSAGNLNITVDGLTYQVAIAAGTYISGKTPMLGASFTAAFVNSGTAGNLYLRTGFTAT